MIFKLAKIFDTEPIFSLFLTNQVYNCYMLFSVGHQSESVCIIVRIYVTDIAILEIIRKKNGQIVIERLMLLYPNTDMV